MADVSDASAADTAIPASARRAREARAPRPDSAKTRAEATPAPINAALSVTARVDTPMTAVADTTAKAAPALTPRMPGSASGLRVIACMIDPASPSAPPMMSAAMVRGTRRDSTTRASWEVPPWTRDSQTIFGAICRDPRASEAITTTPSTSAATAQAIATLVSR